jgi:hypothetical protein
MRNHLSVTRIELMTSEKSLPFQLVKVVVLIIPLFFEAKNPITINVCLKVLRTRV